MDTGNLLVKLTYALFVIIVFGIIFWKIKKLNEKQLGINKLVKKAKEKRINKRMKETKEGMLFKK